MEMVQKPRAFVKLPVEGIQYSNVEFGLDLEYTVDDSIEDPVHMYLQSAKLLDMVSQEYHRRLVERLKEVQANVLDDIRLEVQKEYAERYENAKTEIINLRKQVDELQNK
jgi:hypothetical protein